MQVARTVASAAVFLLFGMFHTTHGSSSSGKSAEKFRMGNKPDEFVQVSPLIVAVACQSGVLVLAVHPTVEDEPLLYHSYETTPTTNNNKDELASATITSKCIQNGLRDLPSDYKGPFRIHAIDKATTLACVGWRADGETLVRHCRSLSDGAYALYGSESAPTRVLAQEISRYLAHCTVSETARTLACAALLVDATSVWLVDSIGSVPVRALCVGGGTVQNDNKSRTATTATTLVANVMNQKLAERVWTSMEPDEALQAILELFNGEEGQTLLVPNGSPVEIAVLKSTGLQRKQLSALSLLDR
jgi:20S proteasome alpha/beta subunit